MMAKELQATIRNCRPFIITPLDAKVLGPPSRSPNCRHEDEVDFIAVVAAIVFRRDPRDKRGAASGIRILLERKNNFPDRAMRTSSNFFKAVTTANH